jgi:hypothetical protein
MSRSKLENEVQKSLREPATRPLPADPFEGFRDEASTCGCGLYVHASRRNPEAIHIADCPFAKPFRDPISDLYAECSKLADQEAPLTFVSNAQKRRLEYLMQACRESRERE